MPYSWCCSALSDIQCALTLVLTEDDDGQVMFSTQLIAGPAYFVIAAFIGMVVLIFVEADRIGNQIVVNMLLINIGGKYKLVLNTQYFFCWLYPNLMDSLGGDLPRAQRLRSDSGPDVFPCRWNGGTFIQIQ